MFRNTRFAVFLTLPLTITLAALLFYPVVYTVYHAFHAEGGGFGLANFAAVAETSGFWQVLGNTVVFTIASTLLSFLAGFSIAYAMEFVSVGRRLLVSIFVLPLAIMPVVSGLTWSMMLNPALGVVNYLLHFAGIAPQPWATGTHSALLTVILIDSWQWTPFCFLIIYAGFQSLPQEPIEASLVDGANLFQQLVHVILPMLKSILAITLIFRFMEAYKAFDIIYVVTKGGPGRASETLVLRAFMEGFRFLKPEATAVIAVLLLVVTTLVTRPAARLIEIGAEE